ncbi:MAG: biotin synthase, partial [Idiomarina sp.]|nr:biotin synthase [Idiomarina sp.]
DLRLFERLGITPEQRDGYDDEVHTAVIEDAIQEQQNPVRYYDAS